MGNFLASFQTVVSYFCIIPEICCLLLQELRWRLLDILSVFFFKILSVFIFKNWTPLTSRYSFRVLLQDPFHVLRQELRWRMEYGYSFHLLLQCPFRLHLQELHWRLDDPFKWDSENAFLERRRLFRLFIMYWSSLWNDQMKNLDPISDFVTPNLTLHLASWIGTSFWAWKGG